MSLRFKKPVMGHVLRHMLKHLPSRHVLERHVAKHAAVGSS